MRQYKRLQVVATGPEGAWSAESEDDFGAGVMLRREGEYVALSFYSGALEVMLRFRQADLLRTLNHLVPGDQIGVGRSVGNGPSTLFVHQRPDGSLVLRPTLAADAVGALALNFEMPSPARAGLLAWLGSS